MQNSEYGWASARADMSAPACPCAHGYSGGCAGLIGGGINRELQHDRRRQPSPPAGAGGIRDVQGDEAWLDLEGRRKLLRDGLLPARVVHRNVPGRDVARRDLIGDEHRHIGRRGWEVGRRRARRARSAQAAGAVRAVGRHAGRHREGAPWLAALHVNVAAQPRAARWGGERTGGGGDGGNGGGGGDCVASLGGDGGALRRPQSAQSLPELQMANSLPGPPSSQKPSFWYVHELRHDEVAGGDGGKSGIVHVCMQSMPSEALCCETAMLQ
eukprot:3206022-Prymnesium_polylepis.4